MAFSPAEQTQIKALILREGGPSAFADKVQALYAANAQATAVATLTPAVTVTVQDWTALNTYVAGASSTTLYSVMGSIAAAAAAKDATQLGPLLVALYGAAKVHFGL